MCWALGNALWYQYRAFPWWWCPAKGSIESSCTKEFYPHPEAINVMDVSRSLKLEKNVQCQFCTKTFRKGKAYTRHANSHHPLQVAEIWLGCADCDQFLPGQCDDCDVITAKLTNS